MTDGGISPYGSPRNATVRRIRTHHLQAMKDRGERWAMLTAYDMHSGVDLRRGRHPGAAGR